MCDLSRENVHWRFCVKRAKTNGKKKRVSTLSTGAQKLSEACNFFQMVCDDFSKAFTKRFQRVA